MTNHTCCPAAQALDPAPLVPLRVYRRAHWRLVHTATELSRLGAPPAYELVHTDSLQMYAQGQWVDVPIVLAPEPAHPQMSGYSRVLRFLSGQGADSEGRTLAMVLGQDDEWFERQHDFVQWLFPATSASAFNPHAPVLTPGELAALGRDPYAREGLQQAYGRMLSFLGLQCTASGAVVETGETPRPWMGEPDHNDLRITRVLACLAGAGMQAQACALLDYLQSRFGQEPAKAGSLRYWREAVHGTA